MDRCLDVGSMIPIAHGDYGARGKAKCLWSRDSSPNGTALDAKYYAPFYRVPGVLDSKDPTALDSMIPSALDSVLPAAPISAPSGVSPPQKTQLAAAQERLGRFTIRKRYRSERIE